MSTTAWPADYKALARRGIDVKGKIVIARYGDGWRGLKPKLAQEHGAIGCIIYSDPYDDGYFRGDVYPKGGWRPSEGVQRGSVLDVTVYPGDPLTPGVGATKDAKRLAGRRHATHSQDPGAADLLRRCAAVARGARRPGGTQELAGRAAAHLSPGARSRDACISSISSDWGLKPLYDVIAKMHGADSPDEWVVRGNHRDGWVFGAWDPLSGQIAMLAEAKAIGALLKSGWRPRRTLIYASWDGEEPGLLGSTEWAEAHAAELQHKAVLYLNSDSNTRGFLDAQGSHSLQHLLNDVAGAVKDPETGVTTQARLRAHMLVDGYEKDPSDKKEVAQDKARDARLAAAGGDLPIGALGSGSDYTPFLQHLGVTSLSIEYQGEDDQLGVYHSNYDSFDHYVRFGDPAFAYGVAEAQTTGRVVLRMADAQLLPLQFTGFADTVADYVTQLHELVDEKRGNATDLGRLLDQNAFGLAADPTRVVLPPPRAAAVPAVDFAPLDAVVARLKASARAYDEGYTKMLAAGRQFPAAQRRQLNGLLQGMEQKLTDPRGLPNRDWFKHFVYAPGRLTGYGVKTLPGVREAIDASAWDEANQYTVITAGVLSAYCDQLDQLTALLGRGG